jgi:hypothetical protein
LKNGVLLEDLTAHVTPVSVDMVLRGIPQFGNAGLTESVECLGSREADPPFLIGESLEEEGNMARRAQSPESLHDGVADFP